MDVSTAYLRIYRANQYDTIQTSQYPKPVSNTDECEVLLRPVHKLRENKDLKGITVCGIEINISQYADDTTMILDGSKKSFTSA